MAALRVVGHHKRLVPDAEAAQELGGLLRRHDVEPVAGVFNVAGPIAAADADRAGDVGAVVGLAGAHVHDADVGPVQPLGEPLRLGKHLRVDVTAVVGHGGAPGYNVAA